ncbi:MAG: DUF1501 domain-containing protein [Verrucomicrobiae bacterium]|nr:DUF1501 domain-containing protein [Verrucomicrobiae bacterium]MCP5539551.1 DUF1501 domain-containing protein [Akkermansiaceae bacterium]MCP5550050.1 DUF1501 domain-containing protein [Akkermansiaceae bacterium]
MRFDGTVFPGRRAFLKTAASGFGHTALAALLHGQAAAASGARPLAAHAGHFPARAKRVIFLFMQGGPSHVETFDAKPKLDARSGEVAPFARAAGVEQPGVGKMRLFGSGWKFQRRGQSGTRVSELLPEMGATIDDWCVLNGMHTDNLAHAPACLQIHTGTTTFVWPSMGSWVSYGLGTENENLPAYITISHMLSGDGGSPQQFGSAFLPAIHQGTRIDLPTAEGADAELRYLRDPKFAGAAQRKQFDFVRGLNRRQLDRLQGDRHMEGMIESFELAFKMQSAAPELFSLKGESEATKKLYGIGEKETDWFGRQCLLARRLAESGVRFIQLNKGGWDHHGNIRQGLPRTCREIDRPVAGLIRDLKARGLFEDTLVVWTGEFGRTPYEQDLSDGKASMENYGRGHNPYGFTTLMAGAGIRGGHIHGATDEYGYHAVEGKVHIHDLHATILHQLGLDHERLTFRHAGRDFRLTDIYGRVVDEILV